MTTADAFNRKREQLIAAVQVLPAKDIGYSTLSYYGVRTPFSLELEKRRRLIIKFYGWGWSYASIAEQVESTPDAVRMVLKRANVQWIQGSLWDDHEYRVEKKEQPRMKIVHFSFPDPNQYVLEFEYELGDASASLRPACSVGSVAITRPPSAPLHPLSQVA